MTTNDMIERIGILQARSARFIWTLIFLLCLLANSSAGFAQNKKVSSFNAFKHKLLSMKLQNSSEAKLNRRIQLKDGQYTLKEIVNEIANKAGLKFSYSKQLIPVNKKVNVSEETLMTKEALWKVLKGTSLRFGVSGSGQLFLFKRNETKKEQDLNEAVTGIVTDASSGQTLPGVNILVKGTSRGASTDSKGHYEVSVPSLKDTLVFSFIGYKKQEVPIDGRTEINIQLQAQAISGEEMVVTGYSNPINRREVTGAVGTVSTEDLDKRKVSNVSKALEGQVAGVQVTQSTGAPGDAVQIRIRGEGTIGNNNPLFVIDGIPSRDISFLNPSDIKSLDVLKDASAAAMYGSRASNGVIIIETKKGSAQKSSLNVDYYSGLSHVTNLPNMLNAQQYMNTLETAWDNSGYAGTNPYTKDKGRSDFANTDWLAATFGPGYTHDIDFSTSGGGDKTNYYLSSRYYSEDGVVVYSNDKIDKINFRGNISSDITNRFKIGTNTQLSYSKEDNLNSRGDTPGIIRHAMLRPPVIPVKKDPSNPYYSKNDPFTDLPFYNGPNDYESSKYELTQNPVALAYYSDDVIKNYRLFGNAYGEYRFLKNKNLKFKTNLGVDLNFYHHKVFNKNFGDDDGNGLPMDSGLGRENRPNSISENRQQTVNITWSNTINYEKQIGKHNIKGLLGTEFVSNRVSNLSASRQRFDFTSDNFRYIDFGNTDLGLTNGGTGSEWALFSYFGSISYNYNKKYMVKANLRADASSRFAENYKWGYFPSFSAGWMISEEKFMQGIDWLSQLKLRASWGELGNQEIPNYAYLTLLHRNLAGQYQVSRYGNPNLRWETTTQKNIGIDVLIADKVSLTAEYYNMLTSDILLPITLPEVVGEVSPTYVNSGEVRNKGLEFDLGYENHINDFHFKINANLATLKNEVEKLHPNLPAIIGEVTRTEPGHPINAYYGYVMEGIYQNQAEINSHLHGESNPSAVPGDIKFKDLDGNGIINSNDRTFIGDPHPNLTYGFNFSGEYKGFDFSIFFQGVQGIDRYNDGKKIVDYDTRPFNYTTRVLNSWHGEGTSNTIPRVSFTDNGGSRVSSIYVEDASYLRLKNVQIGYSLKSLINNQLSPLNDVKIYVSGQNLYTFTNYTGLDPAISELKDYGTYPQSRSFIVGINASF